MPLIPNNSGLLETKYTPSKTKTGLAKMRSIDYLNDKNRVGFAKVSHPVDSGQNITGRALPLDKEKQIVRVPFEDLRNAYHTDGYVRQSVDKYAEKVVSAGYILKTNDKENKKYLKLRFFLLSQATGYPFPLLIADVVRRFIRDGNGFLIKAWTKVKEPIQNMSLKGLQGRNPIGGLFLAEAVNMIPLIDKTTGIKKAWIHRDYDNKGRVIEKLLDIDQVYHFAYCPEGLDGWGYSQNIPAIEDVRALRAAEEAVLKLIYRHLNPLIHVVTPDILKDGAGRQEDVDLVIQLLTQMAHDGFIVTGPGYEVDVVGSESQALRADPYLNFFKKRGFAGLGISSLIMGEDAYMGTGGRNAVDVQMHSRAKHFQWVLGVYFTYTFIIDLLLEGGYPILDEDGDLTVEWEFVEFDSDEIRKEQNHAADLFNKNVITRTEVRDTLKKNALNPNEIEDTYLDMKTKSEIAIIQAKQSVGNSA